MPILHIGQTVRLTPDLMRDWYECRAADGAAYAQGPGVGRVTSVYHDSGYCGTCEYEDRQCPGPWYGVDFGEGDAKGLGGMYGACELVAA